MPAIDLNAVQIFVAVAEAGAIRAAARGQGIPRSTVSRKLAELERALAVRLFVRTARTATLTPEGAAYLAEVRGPVGAIAAATQATGAVGAAASGTLRVTVPPTFGERFLLPVIARYLERYPEVRVIVDLSDRRVDLAAEGYDLAVRAGALDEPELVRRRIGSAAVAVVAAPSYLRARGRPDRPGELAAHNCLIQSAGEPRAQWPFRERGAAIAVAVRGRLAASSWPVLRDAAVAGLGVARLPTFYVADEVAAGALEVLLRDFECPASSLYIVYPSARLMPARTRAFLELLREAAGAVEAAVGAAARRVGTAPARRLAGRDGARPRRAQRGASAT